LTIKEGYCLVTGPPKYTKQSWGLKTREVRGSLVTCKETEKHANAF